MLTISIVCHLNLPISAYLNFGKQKTEVSSTFSDRLNILLFGPPQGSIAGLLFSMFTLAICFSTLILLSSPAMLMINRREPWKTNKLFTKHCKWSF